MQAPLTCFLVENHAKFGHHYEDLLTGKGGFPTLIKGQWKLIKSIKEDKRSYFDNLAQKIVEEGNEIATRMPNVEQFITRFNIEWMKARNEKAVLRDHNVKEIWFNNKSKEYYWLSNLFQTLIYSADPTPGIFMGVESAYKAYKAVLAEADGETISAISRTTDLKKAKKFKIVLPEEKTVPLMANLINRKFSQNPLLENRLTATHPLELVEHTDSAFWGDGSSSNATERGDGQNMLGQILMNKREMLREEAKLA